MSENINSLHKSMTTRYSKNAVHRYERIFGHSWVSTGGETTTKELCLHLNLKPKQKVLDVGSGIGGSALYMARQYGVFVEGIDLSADMMSIAEDRLRKEDKVIQDRVQFKLLDATKADYSNNSFDVIYSRDTVIHIKDKDELYRNFLNWLKPGGYLLVSDYCTGDQVHSDEFKAYMKERNYDLRTVKGYGDILRNAGFKDVQAIDKSMEFIEILRSELKYFTPTKDSFLQEFSQEDYDFLVDGWKQKIIRVTAGDQTWGLFIARK